MIYTLLLRDKPVLEYQYQSGYPINIMKIYNENLLPICLKNNITNESLIKWIGKRSIPSDRPKIKKLLKQHSNNLLDMVHKSYGLSLSDQYWIRPDNEYLEWNSINFFDNEFSYDFGNILLSEPPLSIELDFISPDISTNGRNPKAWRIKNNKRYLIKGSMESSDQEGINETIISHFINHSSLPIKCSKTSMTKINNKIFSVTENFLNNHSELVPASDIYFQKPKMEAETVYSHLVKCCKDFEIPNVTEFLDNMIFIDYLINNKDRHLGNFGFLRDTETMKFIGPAPLYDNGNSLWFNEDLLSADVGLFDDLAKPFSHFYHEQIKYIKNKNIYKQYDLDYLKHILKKCSVEAEFDPEKIKYISILLEKRYKNIEKILGLEIQKEKENIEEIML